MEEIFLFLVGLEYFWNIWRNLYILSLLDVSFLLFAYQFLFRFTMDLLLSGSVVLIMLRAMFDSLKEH